MPSNAYRIVLVFSLWLAVGYSHAFATEPSGIWTGTYECSNKWKLATLTFESESRAVYEFNPRKNDTASAAGSYSMDVWRKGNELLLTPREWIQKPANIVMVSIRITHNKNSLKGTVEHKSCGEIELTPLNENDLAEIDKATGISPNAQFPLYFTSVYKCDKGSRTSGAYWKIDQTSNRNLTVDLSIRDFKRPSKSRPYSLILNPKENYFNGLVAKGNWGIQLKFEPNGKPPTALWTDKTGQPTINGNCIHPILTQTTEPVAYWNTFFDMANTVDTNISTVASASMHYKTLPATRLLPPLEQENYKSKRKAAWQTLHNNYVASIPSQLKSIDVKTPEQREAARAQIIAMSRPGFTHKINFSTLYTQLLLENGVPSEALYFSDSDTACERVRVSGNIGGSLKNLEWLVGLPAMEWDQETTQSVIDTVDACAQADTSLQKVATSITKKITSHVPKLNAAREKVTWLQKEATSLANKPRNLDTLLASNNYHIEKRKLKKQRIDDFTYQHYFNKAVQPARLEALNQAKKELNFLPLGSDMQIWELEEKFAACRARLGEPGRRAQDWLQTLNNLCISQGNTLFLSHLEVLATDLDKKPDNPVAIELFITRDPSQSLDNFANTVGLIDELYAYRTDLNEAKQGYIKQYQSQLIEKIP